MGEYTGRATEGIFADVLWGSTFLAVTLIFLFTMFNWDLKSYILLGFMLSMLLVLFIHLVFALIPKKLIVSDIGIFLYRGKRLIKKEYWNDIYKIQSSVLAGKYARKGFTIFGKGILDVNDRDVSEPSKILSSAFKEIASIAAGKNIVIDDMLGWAPDVIGGIESVDVDEFKGKWYAVKHISPKIWLYVSFSLFVVGIILSSISQNRGNFMESMGTLFILFSILVGFSGMYESRYYPDEIYFDDKRIAVKLSPWG